MRESTRKRLQALGYAIIRKGRKNQVNHPTKPYNNEFASSFKAIKKTKMIPTQMTSSIHDA